MKKVLSIVIALVMLSSLLTLGIHADPMGGVWEVVDGAYTSTSEKDGNNFNYYQLGENDDIILTATITFGEEHGFMFGVKDIDGDGIIKEDKDEYYLVDFLGSATIGIERNYRNWGGWAAQGTSGKVAGDTAVVKVEYYQGAFTVYVDDNKMVAWVDEDTALDGKGFGLCSKSTTATFTNVSSEKGKGSIPEIKNEGTLAEGPNGGTWTVDGNKYISEDRVAWPSFDVYGLGVDGGKKFKISAKITVGSKADEPTGQGGDLGFMVGVGDINENGLIDENGDIYYLIDITDTGGIGIERNNKTWGGWDQNISLGYQPGEVIEFVVIYDPATATIEAYADGDLVIEYVDDNPLHGDGIALASKVTGGVYEDVKIEFDNIVPPEPQGDDDDDDDAPIVIGTKPPKTTDPATTTGASTTDPATTGDDKNDSSSSSANVGLIVGISCGAVALIAIVVAVIIILKKKKG